MEQRTIDFNKELLFGEIGALISAPAAASIASKFTDAASVISSLAVAGAIVGAALFWIITRIWHKKRRGESSVRHLARDIAYFTPAAFSLTMLIYYPTLFFISNHLLTQDYRIISSVIASQLIAFSLLVLAINIYRYLLLKFCNKQL